jgi:hypothetical protein
MTPLVWIETMKVAQRGTSYSCAVVYGEKPIWYVSLTMDALIGGKISMGNRVLTGIGP